MKTVSALAFAALAPALIACSTTPATTPPPDLGELIATRDRIVALINSSATQADLPPGGTSSYRGAYVGEFVTSRTSGATRVGAEMTLTARFGDMPEVDVSLDRIASPDTDALSGSLTATNISVIDGEFEGRVPLSLNNVPLEGGAVAETLTTPVNVLGAFSSNANQTSGTIGTGAVEGFNMNGFFAAERQP